MTDSQMEKDRMKSNAINVPMPLELREQVRGEAKRLMLSESAIVRLAVMAYFKDGKKGR